MVGRSVVAFCEGEVVGIVVAGEGKGEDGLARNVSSVIKEAGADDELG